MNNIKNIYQHAGKSDDQQNLKDILESALLSTPEGVTYNSPNVPMTSTPVKKPSARKSLCLFTNILDVQPKTAKRRFVTAKSRRKSQIFIDYKHSFVAIGLLNFCKNAKELFYCWR